MSCEQPYLVTTCNFRGKDYVVKMNILKKNSIELRITDKCTSEEWHCNYDNTYIENLTQKTGNYKQFDIFTTMLKSGLLKTSECVTLDLLTFDDLEALRNRRTTGRSNTLHSSHILANNTNSRRYLILTYTVEFDRIHYPLPLEYCGPPDPQVLQANIRKLKQEVSHLQTQLVQRECYTDGDTTELENRVQELTSENKKLKLEINKLNDLLNEKQNSANQVEQMYKAMQLLEDQVRIERTSLQKQILELRQEKSHLVAKLQEALVADKNLQKQLLTSSKSSPAHLVNYTNRRDTSPYMSCRKNIPRDTSPYLICRKNNPSKRNKFIQRKPDGKKKNTTSCPGFNFLHTPSHSFTSESSGEEVFSQRKSSRSLNRSRGSRSSSARSHNTELLIEKSKCSCKDRHRNSEQNYDTLDQQYFNKCTSQHSITSLSCCKNSNKNLKVMETSKQNIYNGALTNSMSDLEKRIIALQRLLRDGLLLK